MLNFLPTHSKWLRRQLAANPTIFKMVAWLVALLRRQGKTVSPNTQEFVLRDALERSPHRDDLAFNLAMMLMQQGRPVPPELELKSLRHCLTEKGNSGRLDLYDRFSIVALETMLVKDRRDDETVTGEGDQAIVTLAKRNLDAVNAEPMRTSLPSYGVRWGEYADRMHHAIASLKSPVEVVRYAQTRVGFEHRQPAAMWLRHLVQYESELRSEFPQYAEALSGFDDPLQSAPETRLTVSGRTVSNIVPYLSRVVLSCLTNIPAPQVVMELGGGYGAPARLWLTNPIHRASAVIIVDIPESLFFAEVFLRTTFGNEAVYYVENGQPLPLSVIERYRVVLCPVPHLSAVEQIPVDLVVNTGSLQEMSEDWVDYYMDWLDRQSVRYFYSLNYAAQPLNFLAESINLWSPRPSARWTARLLRWNPSLVRMQSDRNFLESLFEKVPSSLEPAVAQARLAILAERTMSGEVLIECLDLFRRCPIPDMALAILRNAMTKMPFHPKEALWLAQWLERRADQDFLAVHGDEIIDYREMLAGERKAGVEGTT